MNLKKHINTRVVELLKIQSKNFFIIMKCLILIPLLVNSILCAINWQPCDWAFACDFRGSNLTNVKMKSEYCSASCARTPNCTHYTWTNWNGGTCWMKFGPASISDAYPTTDLTMVCGLVPSSIFSAFK